MNDCIFCKIAKEEIPSEKVYEDKEFFAFLDINPINPGHVLLIPKKHYDNLYEIPNEVMEKIGPLIKKIALAVKEGVAADGINIGMNNEKAAGQLVWHAHLHIIPRFLNDGHISWHGTPYLGEGAKQTAEKIKNNL